MSERIILPGPGSNGAPAELTPLQEFAKEIETATLKVCNSIPYVPSPYIQGILFSMAQEVGIRALEAMRQQQAQMAMRAMQEAAKIKPQPN
jgi:hypothetical protein